MTKRFLPIALVAAAFVSLVACDPEPPLHLYDAEEAEMTLPVIDLDLQVYWNYDMIFSTEYKDWKDEWYYGWDDEDRRLFGELGYTEPSVFSIRRYYTGDYPYVPHTGVIANTVEGNHYVGRYDWGFWDILVWNQISTLDGVQSLIFDERTSLDSVTAYTNPSMHVARYQAPHFTNSFYEPEPLFAAYEQGIEVNKNLDGFTYDSLRNVYTRTLQMTLRPITYVYLTQVILHHNRGRISAIDGSGNLSGLARTTNLNTGVGGRDAITVYYNTRLKKDKPLLPYSAPAGTPTDGVEHVDIVGGRLMTFGLCGHAANDIATRQDIRDTHRHYMDVTMQFNNGMDSTFVFDVTDQVRRRFKGGVITVELDMDTIPVPSRNGGSGFDAVVKDFEDGGTHEFDM